MSTDIKILYKWVLSKKHYYKMLHRNKIDGAKRFLSQLEVEKKCKMKSKQYTSTF